MFKVDFKYFIQLGPFIELESFWMHSPDAGRQCVFLQDVPSYE